MSAPIISLNHRVSSRELRRKLNSDTALLHDQIVPAINQLLENDRVTQQKITRLETGKTLTWRERWAFLRYGTLP